MGFDLVLSSGFLAFARHTGVLRAVERSGLDVTGVCGTSSGALVGALWAAGVKSDEILERIVAQQPFALMRWNWKVWQGLYSLDDVVTKLTEWLPERIEDLPIPFGVGVIDSEGHARVLSSGPLPQAVAASCAIPALFVPVDVEGEFYRDGGDGSHRTRRLAAAAWGSTDSPSSRRSDGGAETDLDAIDALSASSRPRNPAPSFGFGGRCAPSPRGRRARRDRAEAVGLKGNGCTQPSACGTR